MEDPYLEAHWVPYIIIRAHKNFGSTDLSFQHVF